MKMISVYDSQLGIWSNPQVTLNKGSGTRAWTEAVNDEQSPYSKHPQYFTAFLIGDWDEQTGQFTQHAPDSIGTAVEFKAKKEQ